MAKTTTTNTVTINGTVYADPKGYIADLIKAGFLTEVQPKAEDKAEAKAEKPSKGKKASTPKVLKVDKNGLQWIGKFNEVEYREKCKEMYPDYDKLYSSKLRASVYRARGWVL